ncbi:MAG: PKD domain-containing protein [Bacteroidaceae bacterium]|nr:PKD domain-containing protein [Bacteroidaceae bacterium]
MRNLKCLLLIASLVPSLGTMAQIEDYTMPDGKVVKIDRSVFPNLEYDVTPKAQPADYVARRKARKAKAQVQLPPYVYNGQDKYFPPIFSQDGGSCGSAAGVGYQFTHEINSYRDADASLPENQYPSHFTWLLAYQTSTTEGMAKAIGIPNVPTYGGRTYSRLFGPQTHDDPDYGWMQGYDKWYSAMWNRSAYDFSLAPTNTPEGRQELKEWLYNHSGDETMHGGGVAGIGVAAYGTWGFIPSSEANDAAGVTNMKYVMKWGDTFNHALTVCGYDDRIEFDLDGDGIVGEAEEDEVGAWIIANSWGDGWENKGFIYCPYKYSFAVDNDVWTWTPGAYVIRQDYRPLRTIKILMDYTHRSELLLSAGVSENLNATKPEKSIPFEHFRYAGNTLGADPAPEVPMLGRWADGIHDEPMEFGYDLTDLTFAVDRTKPLKYFFIVKTKDAAKGAGHIYNASIINYEIENDGVEIPFEQKDVTIGNRGRETIISVIVPGEQLYPPTNLRLEDGVLVWSAPQASSLTLTGYHVYEGTRLVAQLPAEQVTFTPDAGSTDAFAVRAVYQAGQYGQESASSNVVIMQQTVQPETNQIVNLDESGIIIPGAINELLGQATIEFWMRNDKNVNYTHQVGPGWGKFLFHNSNNGTLSVGWDSGGTDRLNVSSIFTTLGSWNHIAIVINGNVLTLYVNGLKKGSITSKTYSGLVAFGDLQFGRTADINQWWIGGLDEIRVWKTARTQSEIKNNMRIRIAEPALHPDLLVYVPMETIEVNGETKLREYVSGKHASFLKLGTHEVVEDNSPFEGSQPTPTLNIIEKGTSHFAGIPFILTAQTLLSAKAWTWTVGDGQGATYSGMSPSFCFAEPGNYSITCEATFGDGSTLSATKEIVVAEGEVPVAAFEVLNDTLPAGDRFSFVNRTEGTGCTYLWSMPGAEVEEVGGTNATALYPQIGTFYVTLTATNPYGSSSVTKEVSVRASAPSARFDVSKTAIMLGEGVQLTDESRYVPLSWHWELNNGSRIYTVDEQSPYVIPAAPGIYDVSLYVTNDLGENTLTNRRYLVVSNDDPVSCLNFTGAESLQIPCPFAEEQGALTLDWWMRPSDYQGCMSLSSAQGDFSTSVEGKGALSIVLDGESVQSEEGYIITNEWHHYAVTFSGGDVRFFRDARLFETADTALSATIPALQSVTMNSGYKGQIDEVRLWGSALTEEKMKAYSNRHIEDVGAAQADDNLLLYYDFNQSSGDVLDRTSGGFNAQRIDFGPDGDAWNSALGVFTLDTEALMHGDISADYLTNYKNPYITSPGTVNPNNSSRFLKLAMKTSTSKWRDVNAVVSGNITTGAHIDTAHHSDIQFETQWSGFSATLLDYRLWQAVKLPAGKYRFSITPGDVDDMQESRIVACASTSMVSNARCEERALAWAPLAQGSISFEVDEEKTISLGIIVNLSSQSSFGIHAFKLEGITVEPLVPTVNPDGIRNIDASTNSQHPDASGIYDLSGRKVSSNGLKPGLYIRDGKKQLIK